MRSTFPEDHPARRSPKPGKPARKHRRQCTLLDRYRASPRSRASGRPSSGGYNPPGTRPRKPCPLSRCKVLRSRMSCCLSLLTRSAALKRTTDFSKNRSHGTAQNARIRPDAPSHADSPVPALYPASRQRAVARLPAASGEFPRLAGLVLYDVARHGARGHRQRTRQVHLSWPAAPGKVSVLGADDDLLRPGRNPRPGIDAGTAARLNHPRTRSLEDLQVALPQAVVPGLLRSELDKELDRPCDPLSMLEGVGEYLGVHVHIFILAGGAGAAVGQLDRHRRGEISNVLSVSRVARRGHHRGDL